jgi:hypothetical protein
VGEHNCVAGARRRDFGRLTAEFEGGYSGALLRKTPAQLEAHGIGSVISFGLRAAEYSLFGLISHSPEFFWDGLPDERSKTYDIRAIPSPILDTHLIREWFVGRLGLIAVEGVSSATSYPKNALAALILAGRRISKLNLG